MNAHVRGQAGFTLIEVNLAMVLMLLVFGATLSVFATMERASARGQNLNESQQQARTATETLAKRMRNLASPSDTTNPLDQQPLERAEPQDLIFRTIRGDGAPTTGNPQNLERYRYCLGGDGTLYEMRDTWAGTLPALPNTATCDGDTPGWDGVRAVVGNVVNGDRAVFAYQGSPQPGVYSELNSVDPEDFPTAIALRTTLWLDPDPEHAPAATTLSTRVFLRNQNRPPLARFTVVAAGRRITLNGSLSDDPEGNQLLFQWLDNGVPLTDATGQTIAPSTSAVYRFDAAAGSHALTLKVIDVGNLSHTASPAQTVTCSSSSCFVS